MNIETIMSWFLSSEAAPKKRMTVEEVVALQKSMDAEVEERLAKVSKLSNDDLADLMGFVRFDENLLWCDERFVNKVILESLHRLLKNMK